MGHVEDRWWRVKDQFGKKVRVKTELFGKGLRYRARYIDPAGRERSKSFPDRQKKAAEDWLGEVESTKRRGSYVDPAAGRVTFREYAEQWLRHATMDESTRETFGSRLRNHLVPFFGNRQLLSIKPAHMREWNKKLGERYAVDTRAVSFAVLHAILAAAVDDGLIPTNPCAAKSVNPPRQVQREVIPWTADRVYAVRAGLTERYRMMVDVAAGCGLRQGEIFGVGVEDIDKAGGWLHVRRQVKRVRGRLVFGLPKNDKERKVPLPSSVSESLDVHMRRYPPVKVTLPWEDPDSDKMVTVELVFTNERKGAITRCTFDAKHWQRALRRACVPQGRENGIHALRHFYASALLDAGESIKAVSRYLGHSNPAFTLRVYTHLMPGGEDRARRAIDGLFRRTEDGRRPGDGLEGGEIGEPPGEDG
jgi:integrase